LTPRTRMIFSIRSAGVDMVVFILNSCPTIYRFNGKECLTR
jgi:hypothetical protein